MSWHYRLVEWLAKSCLATWAYLVWVCLDLPESKFLIPVCIFAGLWREGLRALGRLWYLVFWKSV